MDKRMGIALAICAVVTGVSAYANAITVKEIASHVGENSVIHAEFTQTRKLVALKRPIVSKGSVAVAGGKGIVWQIEHPYQATYIITKNSIAEVDQDGRKKSGQAEQAQQFKQVTKLISSLLELNEKDLSENFSMLSSGTLDQWTVNLAARDTLAKYIAKITMRGGSFVDEVTIEETSGDSSQIQFHSARKDEPLSSRELMLIQGR
ncbi:MAG: outer membrane lipoprotein carrier protein LolA [Nitrospirota bacterium]